MLTTLTDRDYRHNLEITEIAFGMDEGCLVIACDKREAFAQGSEATKQSIRYAVRWIASLRSQ
jgi:hypothetical protein